MKKITDYLGQLGLTESESKIYEGLIQYGPSSITDLSNKIKMNRITTHFNIKSLVQKGLVTHIKQGSKKLLRAEPPKTLIYQIEQREKSIKTLREEFPDFLKTVEGLIPQSKSRSEVNVKYYEGAKNVMSIYKESLKSNEVYSFVNLDKYYEVFPGTLDMFKDALDDNPKRKVWDIAVESPLSKDISEKHPQYFTKFIPSAKFLSGFDLLMYDKKVAIIQLESENTVATLIESKLIYESFIALHHTMWELLPAE